MSLARAHGATFGELLTIAFIVLRLTNQIDWSWWWVLCPFYIEAAIILLDKLTEEKA